MKTLKIMGYMLLVFCATIGVYRETGLMTTLLILILYCESVCRTQLDKSVSASLSDLYSKYWGRN